MKKLTYFLVSLLVVLSTACTQKNVSKTVTIHGKINAEYKSKQLFSHSAGALFSAKRNIDLNTDSEGNFSATFELEKPAYYRLQTNTIYLCPGDSLEINIEQDARKSTFSGTRVTENNYLANNYLFIAGSYYQHNKKEIKDKATLLSFVKEKSSARLAELNQLKGVSKDFIASEKARINGDIINTMLSYAYRDEAVKSSKTKEEYVANTEKAYSRLSTDIAKAFQPLNEGNYLNIEVVNAILSTIAHSDVLSKSIKFNAAYQEFFDVNNYIKALTNLTPEKVNEISDYCKTIQDIDLKEALEAQLEEATRLLKGSPAIDIKLEDVNGKTVKLSDFKGKYLYLDFWATWCGPCKQQAPYFEKLNKEIDSDEIVFISISVDKHKATWKSYLAKHDKKTIQFNSLDPAIDAMWKVNAIPRFILIDRDFNIIKAYANYPSSKEAKDDLLKLLK